MDAQHRTYLPIYIPFMDGGIGGHRHILHAHSYPLTVDIDLPLLMRCYVID